MRKTFRRINYLLHRRRLERELADEMAAHREMMPQNRRDAFGNTLRLREDARDGWGWTWLEQFRQDLRYGARYLSRSPGFTLGVIAVLALGIGVNLAEMHVFDAIMLRLKVRELDSLCRFTRVTRQQISSGFPIPAIEFYRQYNTVLSSVIEETDTGGVYLTGDPDDLRCSLVSGNFFTELGITPAYGRLLDDQDAKPGAPPVAVLGYGYWQRHFGSDPAIVTRTIRLNDKPVQVVGIAPYDFGGLTQKRTFVWLPVTLHPYLIGNSRLLEDFGESATAMYGRLKPSISHAAAEAQFRALAAQLQKQQPQHFEHGEWLRVEHADAIPPREPRMLLIVATWALLVLLVLLSACANLGNMLLARGLAREREIEIRLAVGASRWRVVRQLMTENLLLAASASVAALIVGRLAAGLLFRMIDAPPDLRVVTDWRIVLAGVVLGLISTLAFGLAPAIHAVRRGRKAMRTRKALVSVQVAVSCVLLILGSLLTRALLRTLIIDVNFDYAHMIVVDPEFYFHHFTAAQARPALNDLASRLRQLPGVDGVTMALVPPLGGRSWTERVSRQQLYMNAVDPSYFLMMQTPVLLGRTFLAGEKDTVMVSESAARKLWPDQPPLGQTFVIGQRTRTVVGMVRDSRANLIGHPESVEMYTPFDDQDVVYATLLAHTTGNPIPLLGVARSAASLPGLVPLMSSLEGTFTQRTESSRKMVSIVGSLGAVATLLAAIGLFGLVAFTVSQRTREIGIRLAMGARSSDILRVVLAQYAFPIGFGTVAGVAMAAMAAKILRSQLYGLMPFDPVSYAAGLLVFAWIAVAASLLPARRALKIEPAAALRYE